MKIMEVTDPAFRQYGKVMDQVDLTELVAAMVKTPCPEEGTIYVASDSELEQLPVAKEIQRVLYGEAPIQIGYCNGHNHRMNALEYHRCSEINVACGADQVLILGKQTDLERGYRYNSSRAEAFRLPAGVAVEIYATTLHYAPCSVGDSGFRSVVILSRGTNEPLTSGHMASANPIQPGKEKIPEDRLLMAVNKWLLAHPEGGEPKEAYLGIYGENPEV